jgi:hypothetical protein
MQRTCAHPWCSQSFEITPDDLAFYDKVSPVFNGKKELIPPPTLCPECRMQRRWAMRNENQLYRRTCDLTGKSMISLYASDSPHVVYSEDAYLNGRWDPMDYGRPYDFSRSFFDQFHDLLLAVPRRGLQRDVSNENCEFTTYGSGNKNCYMIHACMYCVDTYYTHHCGKLVNAADCYRCVGGELLYECINCNNCYHCSWCQDSHNCQDSFLLDHCQDCKHCIACKNLRNKEYHIYNQPYSREEFEEFRRLLLQGKQHEERMKFDAWKMQLPFPFAHLLQAEQCTGDYIYSGKNCHMCFGIQMGVENCRYCQVSGLQMYDVMDASLCNQGNSGYEIIGIGPINHVYFSTYSKHSESCLYCADVNHAAHCFGCIGIQHKQYCILNKQYSKVEYDELVPRIIAHMCTTGEYGEFFPMSVSTFPYNDTIAQELFPMTKDQASMQGLQWKESSEQSLSSSDPVGEDCAYCATTGRPFRITKQERMLYDQMDLPLPILHPSERHRCRIARCNPMHVWDRHCAKCQKPIATSYSPERPEVVYCEECYLAEVY